jgi:hypothetical protein
MTESVHENSLRVASHHARLDVARSKTGQRDVRIVLVPCIYTWDRLHAYASPNRALEKRNLDLHLRGHELSSHDLFVNYTLRPK